jgi:hypothetical protein
VSAPSLSTASLRAALTPLRDAGVTFAALVLRVDFEFRFLDLQPAVYK